MHINLSAIVLSLRIPDWQGIGGRPPIVGFSEYLSLSFYGQIFNNLVTPIQHESVHSKKLKRMNKGDNSQKLAKHSKDHGIDNASFRLDVQLSY